MLGDPYKTGRFSLRKTGRKAGGGSGHKRRAGAAECGNDLKRVHIQGVTVVRLIKKLGKGGQGQPEAGHGKETERPNPY